MTPDLRTETFLREELARHSRPSFAPDLSARILRRLAEREREQAARPRVGARLLLGGYWLAAGAASAAILARNPLPEWGAAALFGLAIAAAPLGYAAALWPAHALAWLGAGLRPLAPLVER